jgi:hypothetical protein
MLIALQLAAVLFAAMIADNSGLVVVCSLRRSELPTVACCMGALPP